jgi:hypothetical protein
MRYVRVSLKHRTILKTKKRALAHEVAKRLRIMLHTSPNARGEFRVTVVRVKEKKNGS